MYSTSGIGTDTGTSLPHAHWKRLLVPVLVPIMNSWPNGNLERHHSHHTGQVSETYFKHIMKHISIHITTHRYSSKGNKRLQRLFLDWKKKTNKEAGTTCAIICLNSLVSVAPPGGRGELPPSCICCCHSLPPPPHCLPFLPCQVPKHSSSNRQTKPGWLEQRRQPICWKKNTCVLFKQN